VWWCLYYSELKGLILITHKYYTNVGFNLLRKHRNTLFPFRSDPAFCVWGFVGGSVCKHFFICGLKLEEFLNDPAPNVAPVYSSHFFCKSFCLAVLFLLALSPATNKNNIFERGLKPAASRVEINSSQGTFKIMSQCANCPCDYLLWNSWACLRRPRCS